MGIFGTIFLLIVTTLSVFVSIAGFTSPIDGIGRIIQILFVPVTAYLLVSTLKHLFAKAPALEKKSGIKKLATYYCFILTTSLVLVSFLSSTNLPQIISSIIFSPIAIYFLILVLPSSNYVSNLEKVTIKNNKPLEIRDLVPAIPGNVDTNKRDFLKLIGTVGLTAFVLNLFSRKSSVPFFGEVTNAESSYIKDSGGNKIDPAEKSPTDGYNITQIDDLTEISYFGFVNRAGGWFIMKQDNADSDKSFRYARGEKGFSRGWEDRANLTYDYFDNVF